MVVFSSKKYKKQFLFDSIVGHSFRWFYFRNSKFRISRIDWMNNPLLPLLLFFVASFLLDLVYLKCFAIVQ